MKTPRLSENAVKNHEELFPNHESKLQKTDPEFIALFDNRAFDEVSSPNNFSNVATSSSEPSATPRESPI